MAISNLHAQMAVAQMREVGKEESLKRRDSVNKQTNMRSQLASEEIEKDHTVDVLNFDDYSTINPDEQGAKEEKGAKERREKQDSTIQSNNNADQPYIQDESVGQNLNLTG